MAILGIFSIFQAWILPGFLFLLFFRNIKIIDKIVLSIPLSLVLNYIVIYSLVVLNLYNQISLFVFIIIEVTFIIYILFKNYNFDYLINEIDNFFSIKEKNKFINLEFSLLNLIISFLLIIYIFYALKNLGQPVHGGDHLDMWNKWAVSWSKNVIPIGVEYPQAVPILYSISYVLISNYEVEYFTSAVCIIYPIWIFVVFFRLIYLYPEKKTLIKLSLIITTFFILSILRNYSLFVGLSDPILVLVTTTTFFIFIYSFFKKETNFENDTNSLKYIILISLVASAPAITKQMGLLISFIFPVFYFIIHFLRKKLSTKNFILISLVIFLVSFSWYIYPLYEYYPFGLKSTHFGRLSSSAMIDSQQMNFFMKLDNGLEYLFWKFKYLILLLIILSLNNKYSLAIFLLIVLPYFLIWSLFFVADNRNFVMVSPFFGFILSVGLINLLKIFSSIDYKLLKISKIILIMISIFLIGYSIQKIKNDEKLIFKSIEAKKLRGFPEINVLLYNHLENSSPEHDVITISDNVFTYLPYIGDKLISKSCIDLDDEIASFQYDIIKKEIKDKNFYVLLNTNYCNIDNLLNDYNGVYKIDKIFSHKNHQFYFFKSNY